MAVGPDRCERLFARAVSVGTMGLFEEAGRRFERFKRQAEAVADGDAGRECAACGAGVEASRERCPECGADEFVRVEPADDASKSPDGTE